MKPRTQPNTSDADFSSVNILTVLQKRYEGHWHNYSGHASDVQCRLMRLLLLDNGFWGLLLLILYRGAIGKCCISFLKFPLASGNEYGTHLHLILWVCGTSYVTSIPSNLCGCVWLQDFPWMIWHVLLHPEMLWQKL